MNTTNLPNLEELRRRLRDLYWQEHRVGDQMREQVFEDINRLVNESRAAWKHAKSEIELRELARDRAGMKATAGSRKVRRFMPLKPLAERQRLSRAQALQQFEELAPQDDLGRIRKIGLTVEQWVGILEQEELSPGNHA